MNLKETIALCEIYNITPNELIFIKVILDYQNNEFPETCNAYFRLSESSRGSIFDMLNWLQSKGIITSEYKIPNKGERLNVNDITFNKNFIKKFYRMSLEMGKELFDAYPISCVVNDVEYKLRRVSKKFDSLEDAYAKYAKAINHDPELHKEVIELIKWGKDNNYAFTNLGDFIVDQDWNNIKSIKDNGIINNSAIKLI